MDPQAKITLPPCPTGVTRNLYFFQGDTLLVGGRSVRAGHRVRVEPGHAIPLENGPLAGEVLMLQGRPIDEPVARYGPFVMNTREEIRQAYQDYSRTRFGGWPWDRDDPVHGPELRRFARYPNGEEDSPSG